MKTQMERQRFNQWQSDLTRHTLKSKQLAQVKRANQSREDSRVASALFDRFLSKKRTSAGQHSGSALPNPTSASQGNAKEKRSAAPSQPRYICQRTPYSTDSSHSFPNTGPPPFPFNNGHGTFSENQSFYGSATVASNFPVNSYMPKHSLPPYMHPFPGFRGDSSSTPLYNSYPYPSPREPPPPSQASMPIPFSDNQMDSYHNVMNNQTYWSQPYSQSVHSQTYPPPVNYNCPENAYPMGGGGGHSAGFSYSTAYPSFVSERDPAMFNGNSNHSNSSHAPPPSCSSHMLPAEMKAIVASATIDDLDL